MVTNSFFTLCSRGNLRLFGKIDNAASCFNLHQSTIVNERLSFEEMLSMSRLKATPVKNNDTKWTDIHV